MKTRKAKRISSPDWKDGEMLIHETLPQGLSRILESNQLQASSLSDKARWGEELHSTIFMTLWVSPTKFNMKSYPYLIFYTKDILPVYGGAMNAEWYGGITEDSKQFHSMKDIPFWIEFGKLHRTAEVIVTTDKIPLSKLYGIYLGYLKKDNKYLKLIKKYPTINWIYKVI